MGKHQENIIERKKECWICSTILQINAVPFTLRQNHGQADRRTDGQIDRTKIQYTDVQPTYARVLGVPWYGFRTNIHLSKQPFNNPSIYPVIQTTYLFPNSFIAKRSSPPASPPSSQSECPYVRPFNLSVRSYVWLSVCLVVVDGVAVVFLLVIQISYLK